MGTSILHFGPKPLPSACSADSSLVLSFSVRLASDPQSSMWWSRDWCLPASLRSSLHGPWLEFKVWTFLCREYERPVTTCTRAPGSSLQPRDSAHPLQRSCGGGSALAWGGRWQWPDLTDPNRIRKDEGEFEQVGGQWRLLSRKAGLWV